MAFGYDEVKYRKSSIKPHRVGGVGGNLFISRTFEGDRGLIETGGLFDRGAYLISQRRWYQFSIKN